MWELQFYFILQNLLYYYTEIHLPIITIYNPYIQLEEPIPDNFLILDEAKVPNELKKYEGSILNTYMTEEELEKYKTNEEVN